MAPRRERETDNSRSSDTALRAGEIHGLPSSQSALRRVALELKAHAPFTMLGTMSGIVIMAVLVVTHAPRSLSAALFWTLHPAHVLLSALVSAAMFTRHGRRTLLGIVVVGYVGSVGIATLSDCVIPYVGESLLGLSNRGIHLGLVEKWWLVNPLAAVGILLGWFWPHTELPHFGHVLLSTWASLFHLTMAMDGEYGVFRYAAAAVFLFLAVWIPCCTSDIVFPLACTAGGPFRRRRLRGR